MQKIYHLVKYLAVFSLVLISTSCTAYKVAVDKRTLGAQVDDEHITMSIRNCFLRDKVIKFFDISVYCYEGHVYLVGEYETNVEKHHAINCAKKVKGVRKVTTYLLPKVTAERCGTMDNLKLKALVQAELVKDKDISSTNIEVKALQCNIVLLGIVGSKKQAQLAVSHARHVKGVKKVVSFLRIRPRNTQ